MTDEAQLNRPLAVVEREHIEYVLRHSKSLMFAAKTLGINPSTIYRKQVKWRREDVMAKHGHDVFKLNHPLTPAHLDR